VPSVRDWPPKELQRLAAEHPVNPGDIVQAGRNASADPLTAGRSARESARSRFNGLVQQLESPFQWDDLVVPASVRDALEALAFEAKQRHRFWEDPARRRLFPQGRGLAALLSGPPGTGKTMAAQVIAASLGQDLFRVNLAHLVSKWVGETAKNIDSLLREADALDAILFFDEADAAFARRSTEVRDAQDRFANTDAAHLLQAIESHSGVVLLATNLKGNIDPAFFRRLRYVIEFPKPDAALQRDLWTRLIGQLAGPDAGAKLASVVHALSTHVEATGAQIKQAILAAIFIAQRERCGLAARHLVEGLRRELAKEGRGIALRERERILNHE
jgi:SpoVK/Ycf46/Vps4 family AAA+-type ATPase